MRIAGKKTIDDWRDIEKNLCPSKNDNWDKAFDFFYQRIKTRYLSPIENIITHGENLGEGFAVVNLQCSLIETLESFINGCSSNYNENKRRTEWKKLEEIIFTSNRKIFTSFFSKRKPFIYYKSIINGEDFYKNVRCALLHETQTKENWIIRFDFYNGKTSYLLEKEKKILYRENFQKDLIEMISGYRDAIVNQNVFDEFDNKTLRENFILKFNSICKNS